MAFSIGDEDKLPTRVDTTSAKGKPATTDVFPLLLDAKFRGVGFEVGEMSMAFEQALAGHLYPDRDSGFQESMGRNPAIWTFRALFRNGIAGQAEAPYPGGWRKFMAATFDRTVGVLTHPELGDVKAKCRSCRTTWDVNKRDGVDVDVEFIETTDGADELAAILKSNPNYTLNYEAARLDNAIGSVDPEPEIPDALTPSLLDSIKRLSGEIAMAKAGIGNVLGTIDSYANAIDDLTAQIESADKPENFAVLESLRKLFGAVVDLGTVVSQKARPVSQVVVARDAPVVAVAASFGNSTDDFLRLNPALGSRTSIRGGTTVFAYAA